jgi:hypothetical protein
LLNGGESPPVAGLGLRPQASPPWLAQTATDVDAVHHFGEAGLHRTPALYPAQRESRAAVPCIAIGADTSGAEVQQGAVRR